MCYSNVKDGKTPLPQVIYGIFVEPLQGRADKGLFATTGSFTRDAIKEAARDGATPIDLLDGEALTSKIKELKLGISIEYIEKTTINKKWFENI